MRQVKGSGCLKAFRLSSVKFSTKINTDIFLFHEHKTETHDEVFGVKHLLISLGRKLVKEHASQLTKEQLSCYIVVAELRT